MRQHGSFNTGTIVCQKINTNEIGNIIIEYFDYIKKRIDHDSIFRLLSPLLHIFFATPNSKKIKSEINSNMKNYEIDKLESIFLEFIEKQKVET